MTMGQPLTVYVVHSADMLVVFRDAALNTIKMPAKDEMLPAARFVCVDGARAKEMAKELITRGVSDFNVDYIDDDAYPDGIRTLVAVDARNIEKYTRDIYHDETHTVFDHKVDPIDEETIPCGIDFLAPHIRWRRREVVVFAGGYGSGKSLLAQYMAIKWAEGPGGLYPDGTKRERPVWFATWEDAVSNQRKQIYRHYTCGSLRPGQDQIDQANDMLRRVMVSPAKVTHERDFEWYENRVRFYAKRYGTNFFILDPWSEFEHVYDFRKENETQYVKKIMRLIRRLSVELNAIFIIVTHIPKSKYSDNGKVKAFRVADATGSVQFGSSADRGICVMRTSRLCGCQDHLVVHFDKIKIEGEDEMGVKGTLALSYSKDRHELHVDLDATATAKDWWEKGAPQTNERKSSEGFSRYAYGDDYDG